MPSILLLEQLREPENSLFQSLGKEAGLRIRTIDPAEVCLPNGKPMLGWQELPGQFDALVVRSYRRFAAVKQVARAFSRAGKPVLGLNPLAASFTQDKLCDLMDLQSAGVPVPETWARATDAPYAVVVSKENWGYGGSGVELVDLQDPTVRNKGPLEWVNHHFQEFLPAQEDWRILVCDGQALPWVIVRRPSPGDFRTNTHQGGELQVIEATGFPGFAKLADVAVRAATVLERPCAGVDLREGKKGQPVVLEVNRTPRLRLGDHTEQVVQAYLTAWARALQ